MSQGRYTQRAYNFQAWAFRPYALAGVGVTITAPVDGWISQTKGRLAVPESRQRLSVSNTQDRLWIAKGDTDT